jgi:hypothetical protein
LKFQCAFKNVFGVIWAFCRLIFHPSRERMEEESLLQTQLRLEFEAETKLLQREFLFYLRF